VRIRLLGHHVTGVRILRLLRHLMPGVRVRLLLGRHRMTRVRILRSGLLLPVLLVLSDGRAG
jgi:hypothetical protein